MWKWLKPKYLLEMEAELAEEMREDAALKAKEEADRKERERMLAQFEENLEAESRHNELETRLAQLECEHGEYAFEVRTESEWCLTNTCGDSFHGGQKLAHTKVCTDCGKTWPITEIEYHEAVTADKYEDYAMAYEAWEQAVNRVSDDELIGW